ncbi:hypothetical protein D9M71_662110 [compost metagenome]
MTSSTGISSLRAKGRLASRMPTGMPISTHRPVLTSTSAQVCRSLSHRPTTPIRNNRPLSTRARVMLRLACQVISATITSNSHQGVRRSRFSRPTSTCSKPSETLRN